MLRRVVITAFLALTGPQFARAQNPAAFRDSLATITDVPALTRMERGLELPNSARTVEPILERGLIAHRLWQLTNDHDDAVRSRDTFQKAIQRFPSDAWSHYGYALALAEGPEKRLTALGGLLSDVTVFQSFAEIFGKDPVSHARSELRKALDLRPSFGDAAVLLSDLAAMNGGGNGALLREARDALEQAQKAGATGANVTSALARTETALGNYAAAVRVAAASNAGDPETMAARAAALLLQPGNEEEGGRLYEDAIRSLTPSAAAVMFDDVQALLTPGEAAEWKAAKTIDQQRAWLTRFWDRRAADAGSTVAERLAIHYRRLALAKTRYLRGSMLGSSGAGVLTADLPAGTYAFDQRGVLLIRHGLPIAVISTQAPGVVPNETWVYDLPGIGRALMNFAILRGSQDYTLVNDVTSLLDPVNNTVDRADVRNRALLAIIQDRVEYDHNYSSALPRLTSVLARTPTIRLDAAPVRAALASAEADYRHRAREALRTDTYHRAYTDSIAFLHDIFTMRSPFSRTELTAALALPARDLVPLAGSAGTRYGIQVSVILVDTLQNTVTRADTTIVVDEGRQLGSDEFVHTHVTLPVVPSEHTLYRIAAEDIASGRGAMVEGRHALRDYASSDRLLVSDIVLAIPDSTGDWVRGPERLALALPRSFAPTHPFTVFYEVYNFAPGEAYTTRITVTPVNRGGAIHALKGLFGGKDHVIDVHFDGVAQPDKNGVQQEVRQVATDLGPGTYRLTVEVTGKTSMRTTTTETVLTVTN